MATTALALTLLRKTLWCALFRNLFYLLRAIFMFSTEESLRRRTGPLGTGRLKYLQALVTEYQDTNEKGLVFILCRCMYYHNVGRLVQKTNFRLLQI